MGVVLRVSSIVVRPAAAATQRRAPVAIPDRRWRKFKAVRSALSSATARPSTVAITSPAPHDSPIPAPRADDGLRIALPEHLGRDLDPGQHARLLRAQLAAAALVSGHRRGRRHVAAPEVLRESAAHDVPIVDGVERREGRGGHDASSARMRSSFSCRRPTSAS